MNKSPESNLQQPESPEQLQQRLDQLHTMILQSLEEDMRLDDEILSQFEMWKQNQEPGKFDQSELNRLIEQSRAMKDTIKVLYAEETEIRIKLK